MKFTIHDTRKYRQQAAQLKRFVADFPVSAQQSYVDLKRKALGDMLDFGVAGFGETTDGELRLLDPEEIRVLQRRYADAHNSPEMQELLTCMQINKSRQCHTN